MSDILKQIQALQEQFSNLFETGTTVNRWADAAQKRIDDNPYMGITSRGKEELERLKEIAKLPRDGKAANEIKKEAAKAEAEAARKGIEADLKGNKAERDKQEGIVWKKGLVAGDNKGGCFTKWRAKPPEMNDNNSYNENIQETLISETSDERAKAANVETTRRYDDARNALAITKAMIKNGKDFYTKDEIKELKKKVKSQEKNFKKASDNRIRDNKNQFNRDKRLMNDNNSYNELISQIMDLKEAFSNLFEVEGLGEPSSEVPPSTNKLKKDIKTKNGKVELVSVENELFPYDGNKKEQFQQKVLDTINGMIQGTATLEDLLQIVRQKKAPLKEAMEVLENLINKRDQYHISKKSVADAEAEFKYSPLSHAQSLERMRFGYDNGKDDRKDVAKYRIGMHDGAKHQAHAYKPEYRYDDDSTPADRAEETKNRIKRAHATDTLKEAMELIEAIINEGRREGESTKDFKNRLHKELVSSVSDKACNAHKEAMEAYRKKGHGEEAMAATERAKKEYRKLEKLNGMQPIANEALEIMEAIINEVSIGALARAVENNLPKRKKNEEVAIKAYKQAQNEYEKGSKESPEDEPALYKKLQCTDKAACKEFDKARDAENLKDLNLPKDSKVSANKLFNAAKKVNPERQKKTEETVKNTKGTKEDAKKFLNSLKRDNRSFDISLADPVKSRNEALEEALAVINEVSKEFLKDKDDKAKVKVLKAIIRHGETMTPENPEGDSELLKIRQDSIDRLKKYREKCQDYLEKKEKRNDK